MRVEENREIIKEIVKKSEKMPAGTYEEIVSFQLCTIASMLVDISKSLAVIADKAGSEE